MRFIESPSSRFRVKSLFATQKSNVKPSALSAPVERLPASILQEIAGHISCLTDVLNFGLCSRLMWERLLPRLYADVDLKTNKQCKLLSALAKRPAIARHIRTLAVRPNNAEWTLPEDPINEVAISDLISRLAAHLTALHTFIWDGLEMPEDQMWLKLRKSCPHLVNIGTTVAEEPVENTSHLFAFRDLRKFSFVVKCASLEWLADGRPPMEKLPKRFWAMLVEHCPDLEELVIGGAAPCPRLFDIRPVSYGQWPRLRSLTLGDLAMQAPPKNDGRREPSFMAFLRSHPQLRCLKMQHVGGDAFPSALDLPPIALPNLLTFSGPLTYVRTLPQPWLLQDLSLNGLQHSATSFPLLFSCLQQLTSLKSLSILIDLSLYTTINRSLQPRDHSKIFHSVLASCPRLSHLDLLCFTQPTFNVIEFSNAIHAAPHLRSFVLTKVHASSDEDMTHSAAQIARQNPALDTFTLRYSQNSWLNPTGIRPKHVGTYAVEHDAAGAATSLAADEWGVKSFGYHYSRRFQHKIPTLVPQRRPSLMRLGRSRSSASSHSSVSSRSTSARSFSFAL
ncbi:hypothetical protein DFH07DRAFT_915432 [Mycena maculata]|uniref:F-box domain-containing protein n=1 Tax=Mycena maculata TaxID=230809 RepID=A0AAD7JNR2_9AGAR|nr:hypothetical protein DFH07DRAFT_915432 [Mycena maculata]